MKAGIKTKVMKKLVILIWIVGVPLAVSHLYFLAGSDHPPGFWLFTAGLLVSYTVPFYALTRIRIPEPPVQKYSTVALFLFILGVNLYIPLQRFMPGYHPDALDGIVYLFTPVYELGLIAIFLGARNAAAWLCRKVQAR